MKRQLESEMRGMVDTIHTFTAGAYRMYSPTTAQQSSNVTWKSGQHAEFSFAGEIFYFTLPADPVASAQKRVETAYASLTSQSTNLTDEALVRGVLDEVQKAVNDCKLQVMMSSVYEKAMSDTVRKWDLAPSVNRKVTEEDKNSGIASLAAWYTRYRRELNDVGTRLSGIASYSTRLPPVTTPKTQPY